MQNTQDSLNNKEQSLNDILIAGYQSVRKVTEELCEPLEIEDYVVQTMQCVSPAKWHLAHTAWFFEQFILMPYMKDYERLNKEYEFLFNSYYNAIGPQHCQAKRGFISRPTVKEVYAYRKYVDDKMHELLNRCDEQLAKEIKDLIVIGINHEQQHQELLLTDIKHVFSSNPLLPIYCSLKNDDYNNSTIHNLSWIDFSTEIEEIGKNRSDGLSPLKTIYRHSDLDKFIQSHDGLVARTLLSNGFCYDNETPRHKCYVGDFSIADRLVTNGEYMGFIEDGGYQRSELWLSLGWNQVQTERWRHPIYWYQVDDVWMQYTLGGSKVVEPNEPICHVSYFEADAYARWAGCRLPTEQEWEVAMSDCSVKGNLLENGQYHPQSLTKPEDKKHKNKIYQAYGDTWEWTNSAYMPYPGYTATSGALGEYNGKFMCNQQVLKGGSCATASDHIRKSYRNFWSPETRWQFTGIRLAK